MMFISMSQLMQIMTKHGKLTTHVQILNSGSNQIENKSWQPPELRWKVEHLSLKGSLSAFCILSAAFLLDILRCV